MLIDFHTHAFADNIAERALNKLKATANIDSHTNGRVDDLRAKLEASNVDYGVLLPVATKPSQQEAINNWAASVNGGNLFAFGSVNPFSDNIPAETRRIKELGLKGIKLHPAYQGAYLFDKIMLNVFKNAEELGLPVTIHMGYDPVAPLERHAMPYHLVEIAERFPKLTLIAAHLGGMCAWEEVYNYICGLRNIYLDTAFIAGWIDSELMLKIIKKHSADRVLFGSDLPWHSSLTELELINSLPLSENEKDMILFKNAVQLLGL